MHKKIALSSDSFVAAFGTNTTTLPQTPNRGRANTLGPNGIKTPSRERSSTFGEYSPPPEQPHSPKEKTRESRNVYTTALQQSIDGKLSIDSDSLKHAAASIGFLLAGTWQSTAFYCGHGVFCM